MRTVIRANAAILALSLTACSSGSVTVARPAPRPAPVVYVEPLEVDIARPHKGKLYVQTNRAAYVAIFEIVPERGVELVYPVSARQRRFVVAGLRDVPVWWESSRVTYHAGWSTSRTYPGRYIYVLASDEPLRIPDAAYRPGYLRDVLGSRVYWSANPYATMRALAREFVSPVPDEAWAEDMYALSSSYATEKYRVTRVYCSGGAMYEVPVELADRVWCPVYVRGGSPEPGGVTQADLPGYRRPPVRPDSVVGDNGRRVAIRARGSNGRGPVDRVQEPASPEQRPAVGPVINRRVVPNERVGELPPRGRGPEVLADRGAPKPDSTGGSKSDAKRESKADARSESKPDSTSGPKPRPSGETRAEPKKGRGRSEAKDEKSADGKSKEPRQP